MQNIPTHELAEALRERIRGSVTLQGDRNYEQARRIWNGMIEKRPAIVVHPSGPADVQSCIAIAREAQVPLSIRGGGHNVAGTALNSGGLMINMEYRRGIWVDPNGRTVRVEAGANWGDVDHETRPHGLVVPSGIVTSTGVAGFTLGGGFGWTSRKFGYAADNLLSADVVTAEGELLRASEKQNEDLLWALRGGGGNFGTVTSFEFKAHRHGPDALCGMVVHPQDKAREVIDLYRDITSNAPDELCCLVVLRRAPPAPFLPPEVHGQPIAALAAHWTGDPADGEDALRPIKALGEPLGDTISVKSFIAFQAMLDAGAPFGRRYYWKTADLDEVRDGLTDALGEHAGRIASPFSAILMMHLDGVPSRMAMDASAVGIRRTRHVVNIQAAWEEPGEDDLHTGWARDCLDAINPFSSGGVYVNFMSGDEGDTRVRAAYRSANFERLREVKTKYDPDNFFHGNQNIPPL